MGFEFGFAKEPYKEEKFWADKDIYFFWCGWENVDLYKLFTLLSDEKYPSDYYGEYKVSVDKFKFVEEIYNQVTQNDNYIIVNKLFLFNDMFAYDYLDQMPLKEKAKLRLAFLPDIDDRLIKDICVELYKRFEDGYAMLEELYKAYQRMKKDNIEYIWVYGG